MKSKPGSSLASISAQIKALQAQAEALRAKEVSGIIAQAKEAIAHYGLTAADLGFGSAGAKKAAKPDAPATAKRRPGPKPGKKAQRAAKFRDAAGNTWGGLGKRPRWFTEALAAGKKPEDLLATN